MTNPHPYQFWQIKIFSKKYGLTEREALQFGRKVGINVSQDFLPLYSRQKRKLYHEMGSKKYIRNVSTHLRNYTASHSGIWMFRTVRTYCVTERQSSRTSLQLKEKSMRLLRNVGRQFSNNTTSYLGTRIFSEAGGGGGKPKISHDLSSFQKLNATV